MIESNIAAPAADAATVFVLERKPLQEAASFLARSLIERRNTIPILSGLLIRADADGVVTIVGTDMDMEAVATVPGEGTPGAAFVLSSAAAFADAVKACGDVNVMLEISAGRCRISGGNSVSDLDTMAADDFPRVTRVPDGSTTLHLSGERLASDLARVSPAVSTEETRYYLNGIFLHAATLGGGDNPPRALRFVATDGHRLHMTTQPLPEGAEALPGVILPRKAVALIQKLLKAPKLHMGDITDVTLEISPSRFRARVGAWLMLSKTIDGTFPDYTRVIPSSGGTTLTMKCGDLAPAVERVTAVGGKVKAAVTIRASEGTAALSCTVMDGADSRSSSASVPCAFGLAGSCTAETADSVIHPVLSDQPGEADIIGFNGGYLANILAAFGKVDVTICFHDAASPSLITSPDVPDFLAVLMPMRVGDPAAKPKAPAAVEPAEPAEPAPETAWQRFERIYTAAWIERDREGMGNASREFLASMDEDFPNRPGIHREAVAMGAAQIRQIGAKPADADAHLRAEARARCRALSAATARGRLNSFAFHASLERDLRTVLSLPGFDPADGRRVIPVAVGSGAKRVHVLASELLCPRQRTFHKVKPSGEAMRGRSSFIYRSDIQSIIPAKAPKAAPAAPVADIGRAADLERENSELRERLDRIEAIVTGLLAEKSTARPDSWPLAAETGAKAEIQPSSGTDTHAQPEASVLGAIIADLAARVEAAEARADAERAKRVQAIGWRHRRRQRVAAVREALAAEHSHRVQVEGDLIAAEERATQLVGRIAQLETEAARYAPLVAALAGLAPPQPEPQPEPLPVVESPAEPPAANVVPIGRPRLAVAIR